ncbi:MAG: hypothetical protein QFE16_06920 [Pseudomonadota bacterium]|nr:hypothetical protein [Pseudomonadota bacterium]
MILSSGDLALALRSSMSVPGVFAPTETDGRILGDGGLVFDLKDKPWGELGELRLGISHVVFRNHPELISADSQARATT